MREDGGTPSLNHPPCTFVIKKKETRKCRDRSRRRKSRRKKKRRYSEEEVKVNNTSQGRVLVSVSISPTTSSQSGGHNTRLSMENKTQL
jgi:hypothetical protein